MAAIYDVHGNLPALEAVLMEVEREHPDVVVFGGDMAAGWFPVEVLERLRKVANAQFVAGNCEREMILIFDGDSPGRYELTDAAARKLSRADRDFMASFEPNVTIDIEGLGRVLFCHATPASDEEVITPMTPRGEIETALAGAPSVVVYGHIHVQGNHRFGDRRLVNAGSVGLPYGSTAACWALLGPDIELRQTPYDLDRAVPQLAAAPDWDGSAKWADQLRYPPSAEEALAQHEANRRARV
ncbi:MAG: metallophosphoesterase family protein [Chloroflexota bacterium]